MIDLKRDDKAKDCVAWGTLYARKHKTKEIMQFAFKDNALVLAMSTHFSGWVVSPWRERKRPASTSTSAKTARVPFGDQPLQMLQIPCLIDRYNHNMNGVDIGDQLRAEFTPDRRIRRGGHQALIYLFLLEVAITNTFLLQREGWPVASKLRCTNQTTFRMALVKELLTQYGQQVALYGSEASHIPTEIQARYIHRYIERNVVGVHFTLQSGKTLLLVISEDYVPVGNAHTEICGQQYPALLKFLLLSAVCHLF